jgi:hypothetical protein
MPGTYLPTKLLVGRLATGDPNRARCHLAFDSRTPCGALKHAKITTTVVIHTVAAVPRARLCARCFTPDNIATARYAAHHLRPWNSGLEDTLHHIATALGVTTTAPTPAPAPPPAAPAPLTLAQMAALFRTNHPAVAPATRTTRRLAHA